MVDDHESASGKGNGADNIFGNKYGQYLAHVQVYRECMDEESGETVYHETVWADEEELKKIEIWLAKDEEEEEEEEKSEKADDRKRSLEDSDENVSGEKKYDSSVKQPKL